MIKTSCLNFSQIKTLTHNKLTKNRKNYIKELKFGVVLVSD